MANQQSSEVSESQMTSSESATEPVSIVFENGPVKDKDLTDEIHSLPCRIEYDGPANVSRYFVRQLQEDGTEMATFRGRVLNGVRQQLPDGYRLYAAVEKEQRGDSRVFEVIGSTDSFMRWEYDRDAASYQSPLARAIDFLGAAETFARDID